MSLFSIQNFWCDVVRSAADSAFAIAFEFELRGKSEVCNFLLHLIGQEQVTQLQANNQYKLEFTLCGSLDESANI